jgi:hypothetical protein
MMWDVHPNYPDYEISEYGDIRRIVPAKTRIKSGYILKGRILRSGYKQVKLVDKSGEKYELRANRLVAETFIGPAPSLKHQAAHNDGNKLNNHYRNLRWATAKENCADREIHGTQKRGEQHHQCKFSFDVISAIRSEFKGKRGDVAALARKYGPCPSFVSAVVRNKIRISA